MNDLRNHEHGDEGVGSTHYVCNEIMELFGMASTCCGCTNHSCKKNLEEGDPKRKKIMHDVDSPPQKE